MKSTTILSLLTVTGAILNTKAVLAQIYQPSNRIPIADNTLGTKVSDTGNNNFDITGGLTRGQTLFHSFREFSIPTAGSANFINNPATRDIITRVTGSNYSDLNGKLNSNGANFLLINPNGVVFGPNVQLNVGKAFAASTATGVDLIDGAGGRYTFGTNGNGDAPLLSIDPNVFLNISRLNVGANLPGSGGIVNYGTLQTNNPEQYIGLFGGNVTLNGGKIIAPGGRIELGGLVDFGSIGWGDENNFPKLTLPAGITRSTVTLTDEAIVSVAGNGGGSIAVTAQNLNVLNGSQIGAGISQANADRQAGDIVINIASNLEIGGNKPSSIKNEVAENGVGNAGNIDIQARVINIGDSGEIQASSKGNGNGGNITIEANEINVVADPNSQAVGASINTDVIPNPTAGDRQGGNLNIITDRLSVRHGAYISADTFGSGRGGDLRLEAAYLELIDRASISTNTLDRGTGGNLTIVANTLKTLDGSGISASTVSGQAGNITISADTLLLKDGLGISASTFGSGNAGDLTVNANRTIIDGERLRSDGITTNPTGLFAQVNSGGSGKGGTLRLNTQKLSVSNGGKVQAATFGMGDAGNLFITADEIDVFNSPGVTPKQPTNINTGVSFDPLGNAQFQAEGNAGNLTIDTRKLSVRNGASISSDTKGKGNGGQLAITATESVTVTGAGSTLTVGVADGAVGNGGELKVKTPKLSVSDGGAISTSSAGTGVAGKLKIDANTIELRDRGAISGETRSGRGGNIELTASDYLLIRDNSRISATAGTDRQGGDGGNIQIITPFIMALPGNSDITANAYTGNGGQVSVTSDGLFGIKYLANGLGSDATNDITASSTFGQSGTVDIVTPGTDPGKDSTELPNVPNDASNQISQTCSTSNRQNKLTIAGRGGLPANADEPLIGDVVWQDPRATQSQSVVSSGTNRPTPLPPPAVGWKFDGKGKATLIAAGTQAQPTGANSTCPK